MDTMNTKGLVWICGPPYYESTAKVFTRFGYDVTRSISESDYIVLTGGEDLNPQIYGEEPNGTTYWDDERDHRDLQAIQYGVKHGKNLVGVCRGAQFLNCVPNGGKLRQHVDGHGSGYHPVYDFVDHKVRKIITVHHQQMIPTDKAVLVASAKTKTNDFDDVEVLWYESSKSLCYQAHPEFGHQESTDYFFLLMDRYYGNSTITSFGKSLG